MSELQDDIFENEFPEEEVETGAEEVAETESQETESETEAETETTKETESQDTDSKEETEKEPTPDSDKEPWTLKAVLDERDNVRKAREEADALRKELAELKGEPDELSVFDDENAKFSQQERKTEEALRNTALNMSEAFAETVFGEEKVAAAKEWMLNEGVKSPYALEQFNGAKLPFHEAVKMYDEDMARRNPDAFKANLRKELKDELRDEILAEIKNKPKSDTPSLASKRSVGGQEPPGGDDDFLKD